MAVKQPSRAPGNPDHPSGLAVTVCGGKACEAWREFWSGGRNYRLLCSHVKITALTTAKLGASRLAVPALSLPQGDGSAMKRAIAVWCVLASLVAAWPQPALAEGDWEVTRESEQALEQGLRWLAANQGPEGNWNSNDLGLVGMGALGFLAAGHSPGRGRYGQPCQRALDYVMRNAQPSGLLNISGGHRDMYNHGLATFVLGQAYGMSGDRRISTTLDKALKLIIQTQCDDGGWDYQAAPQQRGHDLSLAVMQAKALRSAVDSGLEIAPEVIDLAIQDVRRHYVPAHGRRGNEAEMRKGPGQFTYNGGGNGTLAMSAAGVVCLQEFGQYDDWRIPKNMEIIVAAVKDKTKNRPGHTGQMPFDAYTLYYVGQALYQAGGNDWNQAYPLLRDYLVAGQVRSANQPGDDGKWQSGGHVSGRAGELYGTAVACFILAMPNRYLPILQEGRIESLRKAYSAD